jgi:hypothetical protein
LESDLLVLYVSFMHSVWALGAAAELGVERKKLQLDLKRKRTELFLAHGGTAATWATSLQHHIFCSP